MYVFKVKIFISKSFLEYPLFYKTDISQSNAGILSDSCLNYYINTHNFVLPMILHHEDALQSLTL